MRIEPHFIPPKYWQKSCLDMLPEGGMWIVIQRTVRSVPEERGSQM